MHWDGDLLIIAMTVVTLALGVPLVRAFIRRLDAQPRRDVIGSSAVLERLTAIEQAVESIAVEVERISENQRFTTKVLASREGVAAPRALEIRAER
jgi:hypothetical protein